MMKRDLKALTDKEYDVVVIGGGSFGVCAAWDASLRGLSVALVEKGDFCGGVSANSFKVVHGGIRYLQHADIVRVRESCRERSALLRIAPHLVQPLPILIPTYGHGMSGKAVLGAGILLYDLLTAGRNRGIAGPDRRIPWGRLLTRDEVLRQFPGVKKEGLTGGAVFADGQIYNPTRLVISFLRSAVSRRAVVANYLEVKGFLRSGKSVKGIRAIDRFTGEGIEIRAKAVLNAAGPWAEGLLGEGLGMRLDRKGTYSRDTCFVMRRRFEGPYAIAVQGRTRDPDAVVGRSARHLFVVPWRDYSLIGVWHVVYSKSQDLVAVSDRELQVFIDEMNWAYPGLSLRLEDVLIWNAGLVPFGENASGAKDLSYGKRSIIIDHAETQGLDGLVTLIGIRYTMARGDAAKAVDILAQKLNWKEPRPATDKTPIFGGQIKHFEGFIAERMADNPWGLTPKVMRALVHNYGSEYEGVLAYAEEDKSLLETIGESTTLRAEVMHAVHEEIALRLSDVIFRRTDLGTGEVPKTEDIRECGKIVARELGWSKRRLEQEVEELLSVAPTIGRERKNLGESGRIWEMA
ncbi:MAG: glycerol-3-phosphate dehydrogenase/oxidase [Pseudomonadota bacterium]